MKLTFEPKKQAPPRDYPELYGMEFVGEIEWDNESYQFNLTAVLRRKEDGTLWYAEDAGCSCPSPFEDTFTWTRLFNLEPLEARRLDADGVELSEYTTFLSAVKAAFAQLAKESV